MRKIKRITHLRQEQKRLHRREAELEKVLHRDWKDLRQTLQPGLLTREALSSAATWIGRKFLSATFKKQRL